MDRQRVQQLLEEDIQMAFEDHAEDEVVANMILDQLQEAVEYAGPSRGKHGGSREGRSANVMRSRHRGHKILMEDYFANNPTYSDELFRRRYRMRRSLFLCIMDVVCDHDAYFVNVVMLLVFLGCLCIKNARQHSVCWHLVFQQIPPMNIAGLVNRQLWNL
jgi:hypothetical protein